jgi:beta-1,4-mannosyltransferase
MMQGELIGREPRPSGRGYDAVQGLRYLHAAGVDDPVVLGYYPVSWDNPYQSLLYSRFIEQGIAAVPLDDLAQLDDLVALHALGARVVLHHHWTNQILAKVTTDVAAEEATRAFLARIDDFLSAGGKLVWTIHNDLPHETRMPDREAELRRGIVKRATAVHVLAERTRELVAPWYDVPKAKIVHSPHTNYIGAYEDHVSRDDARFRLGLGPDEIVYAFVGAIRAYKGLTELLDAFDLVLERNDGPRTLLVAGWPGKDAEVVEFLNRCAGHPHVLVHPRKIASDEMQLFLRAADLAVLPYSRALNSAVLMLAFSFGLPVVAPRLGGIEELVTPEVARTFRPADVASLADAIAAGEELRTPGAREAALRIARRYDPAAISTRFARDLRERLSEPSILPTAAAALSRSPAAPARS